jgi:enoyl-CoA hydratase/carnithine racemase
MSYGGTSIDIGGGVVKYEKLKDGVLVITLNKPERMNGWPIVGPNGSNAWYDAYDMAIVDPDVHVIIVTGSGRAWCAGADMQMLNGLSTGKDSMTGGNNEAKRAAAKAAADRGEANDHKGRPLNYAHHVPKPIIAAINGATAGGGFSQAMACDIRFAAAGAKFAAGFPRRGLIAEWGISWSLPRVVGMGNAMDILLSGRKFTSEEALELGIIQRIYPKETLMAETIKYATDMAKNVPSNSLAIIKEQLIRHQNRTVDQALRESNKLMIMSTTKKNPEFTEGVSSFMESRPPNFSPFDPKNPMQTFKKEVLRDEQAVEDLPDTISKL